MGRRWRPRQLAPRGRGAVALAAAAAILVIAGVVAIIAAASGPAPIGIRNLRIAVVDGPRNSQHVTLDATFFTPAGSGRGPAILLAHGFGATKDAVRPEAEQLARAGFAVLTWSARGMGGSTGQVAFDSPDYEVKDVEQLVTWLARQPRVLLDHPGDPRVGMAGASYGGAITLLAAAYDHRIDAIVPQITWNNLATALFPNAAGGGPVDGVFKRQWAGLLFTQGLVSAGARAAQVAPPAGLPTAFGCGRFLPQVCAMYQQAAVSGRATPQAVSLLLASSPASVAGRIDVPALLIQGENDSLFGLDQANANYQAIRRNGAPADMVWFAGGHDGGDQEAGRVTELTRQWFDRWLKPPNRPWRPGAPAGATSTGATSTGAANTGAASAGAAGTGQPAFAVSRDQGFDPSSNREVLGVATAPGYPGLRGAGQAMVGLSGPPQVVVNPPGGAPPSMSIFPGLGALGSATGTGPSGGSGSAGPAGGGFPIDMPGQTAAFESAPLTAPLQVTGSITVRIRVGGAPQVTLFAKVYDVDQAGNAILPYSLAAPLRVVGAAPGRVVTVQLPAIDYQFAAGHRLRLVLTATDFAYATSPVPAVYQVALADRGLSVPSDPALVFSGNGVAWWAWAAPAAALLAAALILVTGRRGRRGPFRREAFSAALTDVPLEITGLTKRYRDGQLAVDDLSLRVERGQILGCSGQTGRARPPRCEP